VEEQAALLKDLEAKNATMEADLKEKRAALEKKAKEKDLVTDITLATQVNMAMLSIGHFLFGARSCSSRRRPSTRGSQGQRKRMFVLFCARLTHL
jgi:hypothetical protein